MRMKSKLLMLPLLSSLTFTQALTGIAAAADSSASGYSDEQLAAHHYTYYYADAADASPSEPDAGDVMGLYQSVTDQAYGTDSVTGKKWGYGSSTGTSTSGDKYSSVRYYSGSTHNVNTAVNYSFELPEAGDYYVTVGVKNPWSARSFSIVLEGTNVSGDLSMPQTTLVEYSYKVHVTDGELNVAVKAPSTTPYDQYHDPMVGLITVQTAIPLSYLQAQIADLQTEIARTNADGTNYYTSSTIASANAALAATQVWADSVSNGVVAIDSDAAQIGTGGIRDQLSKLAAARTALFHMEPNTSFLPDQIMRDTDGNVIDAHGPGFMYDEQTGKYYWYGEYHNGVWPGQGVRVYSSTDLYNWKDEGMALTLVKSMDDFTNDPLISQLYAGRTDTYNVWADIRVGRIVERPKVIYNEKTHKYVMWAHIDGDKSADNDAQNYGKAQAGYAISDSPTGPFVYQRSYRMDMTPADQTDYYPSDKGMARDMNLFKDDDGTAYLIYSSEENRTLYISKLLDDYSDVAGWHKDGNVDASGNPVRDTSYKAVYGTDYIRVFPGGVREAPAVFKYNGKYYLLTSGATGWTPNVNMYSVADSMLGTWSTLSDPFVRTLSSDPDPKKAFNSQTSSVIPVDAANGKFIYVGDDWNGGSFANGAAKYVWLPIEFGQDSEMTIKWYSSWTKDLLDKMVGVQANIQLPEVITTGSTLALPTEIPVTPIGSSSSVVTPVTWSVNSQPVTASTFAMPGTYTLDAKLTAFNNKALRFTISAIPEKTVYFVNSGGQATSDYNLMTSYMQQTLINKSVAEQAYNASDAAPWGYTGTQSNPAGTADGDIFSTLRYLNGGNVSGSAAGTDLTYKFAVHNGSYTVYTGFNDIWSNSSRKADLYINGEKKTAITFISNQVYANTVNVTDGVIDVTVRNTAAQDPLINWIMIVDNDLTIAADPLQGLQVTATTSDSASFAWDKAVGATSYTLYRSASAEGPYAPVYTGNALSYTDSGISPAVNYSYKVSSTSLSGESALSDAVSVLLDQTQPSFELLVNGQQLGEGGTFEDSALLTFRAADDLSGAASAQIVIDGTVYPVDLTKGNDVIVDLAGKPGSYDAAITVVDAAGNKLQQSFQLNVTTSLDSMNQLLARYQSSLNNSMSQQLHNALDQAQHKLDMNRPDQAAKHMQDFVKHLNNTSVQAVDSKVKAVLLADAQALIAKWTEA
ncbi:glycosyl hydrolase family 43 [Paenibacillus cellulosilyticus]|uniref:Glycosyl hydrolase family 43 n=1 Tax=Paenibacillus cellulosilyticus TaxID=375489 RepID=A0A2V2Z2D0_9BACL|nr:family 43 glycosylhydrolase [Paenibacillus cellulosilyticus]PWW07285.1 glycosyl hydrolase family 43 [Paenibacillus cellulosilyticus]